MVSGRENEVPSRLLHEAFLELLYLSLELVRNEDLVGKGRKRQIEIVRQLLVLQLRWLGQRLPDLLHVLRQRCLEVGEGCGTDVVPDDEEEERPLVTTLIE